MPERPHTPTMSGLLNHILERLRVVERLSLGGEEVTEVKEAVLPDGGYSWQSNFELSTGYGHRLFTDRAGSIAFIRAERSSGDGTTEATFDVEKNDVSLFPDGDGPEVPAGEQVGDEVFPEETSFEKADSFRMKVLTTGGGTGPLRVTVYFTNA